MPASGWSVAPALLQLYDEINGRWPDRRRSTDGFIGDAAHFGGVEVGEKPGGEHVPTDDRGYYRENGVVRAGDFDTRRPDGSEFGDELVQLLIADGKRRDRLAYVIYEGTIWSRNNNWRPARNSGHDHWVHASLRNEVSSGGNTTPADVAAAAIDTARWFAEEEIDMEWPTCLPFKENTRLAVATAAGLKARTAPKIDPSTELRRDGRLITVAQGYAVRVKACAFADDIWWISAGHYWYGLTRPDGSLYFKKAS